MNRFKASRIFREQKAKYADESFHDSKGFIVWHNATGQYIRDLCKVTHVLSFDNCRTMDEYHRAIDSCIEYVSNMQPYFTDRQFEVLKMIIPSLIGASTSLLTLLISLLLSPDLRQSLCKWLQSF